MRTLFYLVTISIVTANTSYAAQYGAGSDKNSSGIYAGFGFGYSHVGLQPKNQPKSTFGGWHGAVEFGANIKFSKLIGLNLAAEYKTTDVENTYESATYMEKASIDSTIGKLGFYWGALTLGGGYSSSRIDVRNVSSMSASETIAFKGTPTLIYSSYGFESGSLRTMLEAQYIFGEFEEMKYSDISLGIRLHFLF